MYLSNAEIGKEYAINNINTNDEELISFLLSLGIYKGEKVKLISRQKNNCTIEIKNSRYSIDIQFAQQVSII